MTARRHAALVAAGYAALFAWLFAVPLFGGGYLAESDLYEFFLPVFLAPHTTWSTFEFGGMPAFADPGEATHYPLHFLFARLLGWWGGFIAAAYLVAATGASAYVYAVTRSRLAAICAGLVYALSEALMERVAHLGIVHTIAWLPWCLLAVERLRGDRQAVWVGLGAMVLALAFLGGNPQTFLYGGYVIAAYAVTAGLAGRAGLRYYAAALAMAALGAAMTLAKALPMLEASRLTARQAVNFGQFVSHANTPAQMLSALLPSIVHEGREAPTYVGMATLFFVLVAIARASSNWRIGFWIAAGTFALLLGAGDATPLAGLAFELPFYDKFRVGARHLHIAALAAAALAGIGIAAAQRAPIRRSGVIAAALGVAVPTALAAGATIAWPDRFELDAPVAGQLLVTAASLAAAIVLARRPASRMAASVLVLVLAADLIAALPYLVSVAGLEYEVVPPAAVQPSVHAAALRAQLAPQHQRLLAPYGTHVDAVVPAAFARVWQIPIAGGYGPMLLADYAALATMEPNGSVDLALLANHNTALDAMAVRFLVLPRAAFTAGETVERGGIPWSAEPAALPVGPPECGQRHVRHATYAFTSRAAVAEVALAARLRCSEDVVEGTEVATLTISGGGRQFSFPLRAGIEIAEEELRDDTLRRRARHRPAARAFDAGDGRASYISTFTLPAAIDGEIRLDFTLSGTAGSMTIDGVTALGDDRMARPQSRVALLLGDSRRWRQSAAFATSRRTDRGADAASDGEGDYAVLENLRAQPRAWVVGETIPLSRRDRDIALHYALLPDGRRFDPRSMAVADPAAPARTYRAAAASAEIRSVRDGAIAVTASTAAGGILVLSETFYPGWTATIDGRPAPVQRVNGAMQGVELPPGTHRVEFTFAPTSLRTGEALSGVAAAAAALLIVSGRRRSSLHLDDRQ